MYRIFLLPLIVWKTIFLCSFPWQLSEDYAISTLLNMAWASTPVAMTTWNTGCAVSMVMKAGGRWGWMGWCRTGARGRVDGGNRDSDEQNWEKKRGWENVPEGRLQNRKGKKRRWEKRNRRKIIKKGQIKWYVSGCHMYKTPTSFFPVVIYFSSLAITSIHSLPSCYPSVYLALCLIMPHKLSVTVPSTVHC